MDSIGVRCAQKIVATQVCVLQSVCVVSGFAGLECSHDMPDLFNPPKMSGHQAVSATVKYNRGSKMTPSRRQWWKHLQLGRLEDRCILSPEWRSLQKWNGVIPGRSAGSVPSRSCSEPSAKKEERRSPPSHLSLSVPSAQCGGDPSKCR